MNMQNKKLWGRCLSWVLSLVLLIGLVPAAAAANMQSAPQIYAAASTSDYSVSFDTSVIEIAVGDTKQINVTSANKSVTWSSSNSSVATVTNNGLVTGIKAGTATITATSTKDHTKTATCKVTVSGVPNPTINNTKLSLYFGQSGELKVSNIPSGATIQWSTSSGVTISSNNTVSSSGESTCTVTAGKSAATPTVTAKVTPKVGNPVTLTCAVTVTGFSLSATELPVVVNKTATLSVKETLPTGYSVSWSLGAGSSYISLSSTTGSSTVVTGGTANTTAIVYANIIYNKDTVQTLECRVSVGYTADAVKYTTNGTDVIDFVASDFNDVCYDLTKYRLEYIRFTSLPTTYGTLYYNYDPATGRGTPVTTSRDYGYNTGTYLIEDLTFVPNSTANRTVTLAYTGYSINSSTPFTGTVEISIGANAGDLTYTITKNQTLALNRSDFYTFCRDAGGSTLEYVYFTSLPSKSQGGLYYDYNSSTGKYNYAVTASSTDRYYYSGSPALADVTFVPATDYTGTVTVNFTAVGSGGSKAGTLTIKVDSGNTIVSYVTAKDTAIRLDDQDFIDFSKDKTGATFNYVTFTLPASSKGVLYVNYSASSKTNTKVTASGKYYRSSSPYLEDITFVPATGFTGSVSIPFTGYSTGGSKFTGTLKIYVGSDSGDITYNTDVGKNVAFSLTDFNNYCKSETNSTLDYVTFTLPASNKGVLYTNYTNSSSTKVTSSARYYRSQSPYVDDITFVPAAGFTGSVSIPFEGRATNNSSFSGTVVITYTALKDVSVIRYTTTGTPVSFVLRDFTNACDARGGGSLSYVKFILPDSRYGKLYADYVSANQNGGQVVPSTAYNVAGYPALSNVAFVPKAGFSGTATLYYTGADKNGNTYDGTIQIVVSAPSVSSNFSDVGTNYSWAAASIDYLYSTGVVTGINATQFAPGNNITRGDFVLMLYRAFNMGSYGLVSFPDVPPSSYYAQAIAAAKALNIATGTGTGNFNPTDPLTRQDAMVLMQRTLNATGHTMADGPESALSAFSDRGSVASYAKGAAAAMVQAGIIQGNGAAQLNPTSSLSRAEMATILHRVLTM